MVEVVRVLELALAPMLTQRLADRDRDEVLEELMHAE
jgi:hypothetical protein